MVVLPPQELPVQQVRNNLFRLAEVGEGREGGREQRFLRWNGHGTLRYACDG